MFRLTAVTLSVCNIVSLWKQSIVALHGYRLRRSSKREKPEERNYGNSPEVYEEIRMRLLQEKAVVNGVEALQERWQMIMFMYHDCVDLNQGRIERHLSRLTVKRQEELIILAALFFLACLPVAGLMVLFAVAFR